MTLLLPTLATAFAAFCIWLTVRIVNRKERWAKWTLAGLVVLPVLYVLSFGPVSWCLYIVNPRFAGWTSRVYVEIYSPLRYIELIGPDWVANSLAWYELWGARKYYQR